MPLEKKSWLSPSLGAYSKCSFDVTLEKKLQNFSQQGFSFVCFWRNAYRSALLLRNLLCLEKFLVVRLHEEITLKSMSHTKEKCDSLVLSRFYLWMVWRYHRILRFHCYNFCLETTAGKDTWIRTTSVTILVILFESKGPSQELPATLKTKFWKTPYSWILYVQGSTRAK